MFIASALVFIATLFVLVVSHELGHFLSARRFGVKVLEFGFGLPPRVWKKKIGETIVSLNWFPIGGFVRLLGEDETDGKILSDPNSFASKPVWQRIVIVLSGVVVNLILAWILFYTVLYFQDWRILYPTSEAVVVVSSVQDGSPAKGAGIKDGTQLVSIDGTQVKDMDTAIRLIRSKPDTEIKLGFSELEESVVKEVTVTPKRQDNGEGRIGVSFSPVAFKQYTTLESKILSAPSYSWDLTKLTFQGLGKLIGDLMGGNYQQVSQSVAGPVGLAAITNDIVGNGWEATIQYLWFMGVISLTLSIFNSLPIPALDGGRALFMFVELVTRKKVNPNVERWVHTVGMVILLGLMVLITFSDIRKLII